MLKYGNGYLYIVYRSRPQRDIDNAVLGYLSSTQNDKEIVKYDIIGSQAHCLMLHHIGIINREELKKILSALAEIKNNFILLESFESEDIHEAVESYVIKRIGIDIGGKMHTARSRNDQVMVDIYMKLRDDINDICQRIINFVYSIVKLADDNKDSIMVMYTHLQQGQLGTVSHYFLSYCFSLMRDFDRLYFSFERVNSSPLGACAIAGSSIGIDRDYISKLLGFEGFIHNSLDSTSSRDVLLEIVSLICVLMTTLSRIAEDLIIWSTMEFGYIEIDDSYSSSSSAMPQKKNPDPLEVVRAKTSVVIGNCTSVLSIVKGLTSGYSRDLQEIKPLLWNTISIGKETLSIFYGILSSVKVKKFNMMYKANESYAISYDIAEQFVKRGMPFRIAHKIVGSLVEIAVQKGNIPLQELEYPDIVKILEKNKYDIPVADVKEILHLTPNESLNLRISEGSPNIHEQQKMIDFLDKKLSDYDRKLSSRKQILKESYEKLNSIVFDIVAS